MREEVERKEMITSLLGKLSLRCLAFTQSGDSSKLLIYGSGAQKRGLD